MNKIKLNIVKYKFLYLCISAILLLPGIVAMIYSSITYPTHAPIRVGIDYTGGTTLQYSVKESITNDRLSAVREGLVKNGIENPSLQIINVNAANDDNLKAILAVRTKFIDEQSKDADKITQIVGTQFSAPELVQVSSVGPTLGSELFKNSLIALTLALLGIIAYLTFRFQFDYALAAILGLVHDTLFVLGVFSILGLVYNVEVDALFVTALLTVIGFSVHDTIVVFDRVRENLKYYAKKMTFGEIMNASINQTLTRSINTSFTTLLTLAALYFFGGVTTKDFVLAMILGIFIGTYSSIFFCSTLVEIWEDNKHSAKPVSA